MATEAEIIASNILASAIEYKRLYDTTKKNEYKVKEQRLRQIAENIKLIVAPGSTSSVSSFNGRTGAVTLTSADVTGALGYTPGDMLKSTYDTDNDGVVDSAERTEIIVRNSTGTTLTKGTIVYLSGATGNRPNALRAQAHTEATSSKTIGMVEADIPNNSDGYVATNGTLHNLDTSAFTAGDAVWLSATTAGAFTTTVPAEPNHAVFVGYIVRAHPTQGRIVLHFQNGYEFDELHGVLLNSPANNDLVVYESSTSLWKNKSIATIFGGTPLVSVPTLAQVTTAGNTTTNAITVGGLTVATNLIYTDTVNGRVGVGTTSPNSRFEVAGLSIFVNSAGANYNENIRLPEASAGWASIVMGGPTLTSGTGATVWSLLKNPNSNGHRFSIRNNSTDHLTIFTNGNTALGTTTDAGYKLDVNGTARVSGNTLISGTLTANSLIRNGGTALQYLLADGSVKTTTAATDFVQYGDFVSYPTFSGKTVTMHPSTVKTLLWGGLNARYTVTDTFTGTYPNAGSTWIRTIELIDGTNSVYPAGNVYLGFWVNYPPLNVTVRTQNTSGTFFGPFTGSDIRVGGGGFAYWKIPVGGGNFIKKWEITLTPQPGLSINLQTLDIVIDNNEGIDQDPFVNRSGSSMYGSLSFRNATTANVTINTNGVVNLLYLRPSNSSGTIEYQNLGGTKAGSMFMDNTIWRFKSHNSTDTLNIFANGNLGIRQTTDAGYAFDVNGTSRLNGAVTATLANVSTANVVYYNSSTGLMTYATAPIGAQFKIDYDPNITGTKNGVNLLFTTSSTFIATTTRVFLNGQRLTRGATYDYVETGTNQITFAAAPLPTDQLIIEYQI